METLGMLLNGAVHLDYELKGFIYVLDVPLSSSSHWQRKRCINASR